MSWNLRAYKFSLNSTQPQIRKRERNVDFLFLFFLLLKIILSFYTQAYKEKKTTKNKLCINSIFLKLICQSQTAYSTVIPLLLNPKTPTWWVWQRAQLRTPLKFKVVLRPSSDRWHVTRSLLGEVSGYHFPDKKGHTSLAWTLNSSTLPPLLT